MRFNVSYLQKPWHTEGYLILSDAILYIAALHAEGVITSGDTEDVVTILVAAGREIRKEIREKSN